MITEVCGGQTHAIVKFGIDEWLPKEVTLVPLYVANEGRFVACLPERFAADALAILRAHPLGAGGCCIGSVAAVGEPLVTIRSRIGATRILDLLSGEQLPRIC